jgi:hypothetical protein
MKISLMFCLCLAGVWLVAPVWGQQVYRCVNAEVDDHVTITNVVSKQDSKHCALIEMPPDTVVPASARKATTSKRVSGAASVGFPVVSDSERQEREKARRVILEQELSSELQSLSQAQKDLLAAQKIQNANTKPYEEKVTQHQRNVNALNKEIDNLK